MSDAPITAQNTVAEWLAHPVGGELLRQLLAAGGQTEAALAPVGSFPLAQLAAMSQGQMPPEVIDKLVLDANGGVMPEAAPAPEIPMAAPFEERITPGRFAGKTVIVTGAGSGIGRATASRVAREGGRVVAVDIVPARLEQFAADHAGHEIVTVTADLAKQEDVDRILAAAGDRIDGLANVAGIMDDFTGLHEVSDAVWDRVLAVNLGGLMRLSRAVLPGMLDAGHGAIVNVTSEAGLRGSAAGVAYTSSKHAVIGLTKSAAFYYGRTGVRINAVAPGGVATAIEAKFNSQYAVERVVPMLAFTPPIAQPEQLAAGITFLLSDDATNLNGVIMPSDGGWSVQ